MAKGSGAASKVDDHGRFGKGAPLPSVMIIGFTRTWAAGWACDGSIDGCNIRCWDVFFENNRTYAYLVVREGLFLISTGRAGGCAKI